MANDGFIPECRIGNKAKVAEWFEVSVKAVDGWIRRGCPVVKKGNKTTGWEFDIQAVSDWRNKKTEENTNDPDKMPPDRRLKFYQAEREKDELMVSRRQLIPAEEVAEGTAELLKAVISTLDTLADVLERDAAIDGKAVARTRQITDQFRNGMHARLKGLGD
jgi:phage terminase Nu1 subunit (DNA packaging protein)